MSQIPGINAYDKPVANDFEYVYAEDKDKGFRKVTKAMMKVLLGVATNLSELTNDEGFVDNTVSDLKNYYLKTETYSKEELDDKIALIPKFSVKVVYALPFEDISETTIYLVPANDGGDNLYTEYINVNGLWEILGTQKLQNVEVTKESIESALGYTPADNAELGKLSETVNDKVTNPTSGAVGQILEIATVDENGKPKTYKAVNKPSGSGTGDGTGGLEYGIYVGDTQPTNGVMYWLDTSEDTPVEPDEPIIPDEPDVPEVTLSSISATYTGGDVTVGTSLTDLTGITVKATYSDGSTANVTGYTLSGTIAEGENTITVSYGGKTATFNVTGVAEDIGTWETLNMTNMSIGSAINNSPIYSDTGSNQIGSVTRGFYMSEVFDEDTEVSVTISVSGITSYVGYGLYVADGSTPLPIYNATSIASGETKTVEMTIPKGYSIIVCGNYPQHYTIEAKKKVVA